MGTAYSEYSLTHSRSALAEPSALPPGSALVEEERQRAEELQYAADHQKQRADEQACCAADEQPNTNEHAQHDPDGGSARASERARAVHVVLPRGASAIDRATSPCGAASRMRRSAAQQAHLAESLAKERDAVKAELAQLRHVRV